MCRSIPKITGLRRVMSGLTYCTTFLTYDVWPIVWSDLRQRSVAGMRTWSAYRSCAGYRL